MNSRLEHHNVTKLLSPHYILHLGAVRCRGPLEVVWFIEQMVREKLVFTPTFDAGYPVATSAV